MESSWELDNEIIDLWDQKFERFYSRADTDAKWLLKFAVIIKMYCEVLEILWVQSMWSGGGEEQF